MNREEEIICESRMGHSVKVLHVIPELAPETGAPLTRAKMRWAREFLTY